MLSRASARLKHTPLLISNKRCFYPLTKYSTTPPLSASFTTSFSTQSPSTDSRSDPALPLKLKPSSGVRYHLKYRRAYINDPLPTSPLFNMVPQSENIVIPGLTLLNSQTLHPNVTMASVSSASGRNEAGGVTSEKKEKPKYKGRQHKLAMRKQAKQQAALLQSSAQGVSGPQLNGLPSPPSDPAAQQHQTTSCQAQKSKGNPKKQRSPSADKRQAPSKESGGVPDPSPLYLAQAFAPPSRLPEPRRILVIMDLNGTLLYRPNKRNPFTFIERPHAKEFLSYCLETFHVAVWSSARPENVRKMVSQLLTPLQVQQCVVTWARDKFGLTPADYDARVQCYKRLTAIWADPRVVSSHPGAFHGQRWDQTNTVLVDDSVEKGRSEPHNILTIPEFSGKKNELTDVLPQVHDYLNELCFQADISSYMRESPFRLDQHYRLPSQPPS